MTKRRRGLEGGIVRIIHKVAASLGICVAVSLGLVAGTAVIAPSVASASTLLAPPELSCGLGNAGVTGPLFYDNNVVAYVIWYGWNPNTAQWETSQSNSWQNASYSGNFLATPFWGANATGYVAAYVYVYNWDTGSWADSQWALDNSNNYYCYSFSGF